MYYAFFCSFNMGKTSPCAVPGCEDRKASRHRFPNPGKDIDRFQIWIQLISNEKLSEMDPMRVFNNFRVCHEHFTIDDKASNMYLQRTAIPSRNLPYETRTNFEYYNYIKIYCRKYKDCVNFFIEICSSTSTSSAVKRPFDATNTQSSEQPPLTPQRCTTPTDIQSTRC